MCKYHDSWDNYDWIYRGYRISDKNDRDARSVGEPAKILVPVTYAQTQTAISFILSTFMQREHFFELRGMGPEDDKLVFALESDLTYQLNRTGWPIKFYQFLLDAFKLGFGVVKCDWTEDYAKMRTLNRVPVSNVFTKLAGLLGTKASEEDIRYTMVESIDEVLQYQGSRIRSVSPYCFYPDPNLPISQFQEGAFAAHEEEKTLSELQQGEGEIYFGTDKIDTKIPRDVFEFRSRRAGKTFGDISVEKYVVGKRDKEQDGVIFTEVVFSMSERQVKEKFGVNLGSSSKAQKWMVVLVNDSKVVAFQPLGYLHDQFPYSLIEYSPDSTSFYNPGLSETIYELQGLITFFLNSHVLNVKKIVQNRLIYNPQYLEVEDLIKGATHIRTRNTPTGDLDRVVKQLQVSDVTARHVDDLTTLMSILQVVTGINDNALGQYSTGRRSATEARNVNAGAAARLRMHAVLAWFQGVEPLGRMMLANTRQGRSKEVYEAIVGTRALEAPFEQVILADANKLAGGYDFLPYDATLPSDRQQQANMLMELFSVLISNPQSIAMLQKDPSKLLNYIAELFGIKNLHDFSLNPDQTLQMPQPQVAPDAQVAQAVDQGAEPVDVGANELLAQLAGQ
jgi:hypothetical protein